MAGEGASDVSVSCLLAFPASLLGVVAEGDDVGEFVSGVTIQPPRYGRGSAAAIAPSRVGSSSLSAGRSIWRRNTASWWRSTMISRSLERPERTARRASMVMRR